MSYWHPQDIMRASPWFVQLHLCELSFVVSTRNIYINETACAARDSTEFGLFYFTGNKDGG